GAMKKSARLAPVGTTISLNRSLKTSAKGCSSPSGPTSFGKMRTWIQPSTLRSASVRYATPRTSGTAITTILTSVQTTGHAGPSSACAGASIVSTLRALHGDGAGKSVESARRRMRRCDPNDPRGDLRIRDGSEHRLAASLRDLHQRALGHADLREREQVHPRFRWLRIRGLLERGCAPHE